MSAQGAFFKDREIVARIAGIERPQNTNHVVWSKPDDVSSPPELSKEWTGRLKDVSPDGHVLAETPIMRTYSSTSSRFGFQELAGHGESIQIDADSVRNRLLACGRIGTQTVHGLGKDYGHFIEFELCLANGTIVEWMEVAEVEQHRLVSVRRWWTDGILTRIEVVNLTPRIVPEYPEWIGCVGAPQ